MASRISTPSDMRAASRDKRVAHVVVAGQGQSDIDVAGGRDAAETSSPVASSRSFEDAHVRRLGPSDRQHRAELVGDPHAEGVVDVDHAGLDSRTR